MKPGQVLRILKTAARIQGVHIDLVRLSPDRHALDYFGHASTGGSEVWVQWIESSIPGRGFEAMRRLCQAADEHNVVVRLDAEDNGSGKLVALYERLGFDRDPAGGSGMERIPLPSRERALAQWMEKGVITTTGEPGGPALVVYRGTPAGAPALASSDRGSFGAGIYFAGDEAQAAQYAAGGGEVRQYHLRMGRPYRHAIREPRIVDVWGEGLVQDIFPPDMAAQLIEQALRGTLPGFGREIGDRLREMGHDGVVASYPDGTQELVAFDPHQVRAASAPVAPSREVSPRDAFVQWFGASAAAHADGRPLVLYHGTTGDVERFDLSYAGSDGVRYALPAIFATPDPVLASDYASNKFNRNIADAMRALQRYKNSHPGEYGAPYEELYQGVKTAFQEAREGFEYGNGANVMPVYMALKNPLVIDAGGKRFMEVLPQAVAGAEEHGHDGLIVRGLVDNASPATNYPADVYVALSPAQVKSATGNRGTYSPTSADVRHSFAGRRSATAHLDLLDVARTQLAAGVDPEQVRVETGWSMGPDGLPRYEISDHLAFLKGVGTFGDIVMKRRAALKTEGPTYLPDILYHPELFEAYPSLREMEVQFIPAGVRADARVGDDVFIEVRETLNAEDALSKVLHEVQHLIQSIEEFALGGSPENAFADPGSSPGASIEGLSAAQRIFQDLLVEAIRPLTLEQFNQSVWARGDIDQEVRDAYGEYLLAHQKHSASPAVSADVQRRAASQWYRRLAGEVEARNVQARLHLGVEERKAISPNSTADMGADRIIVLSGPGGVQEDAGGPRVPPKVYHGTSQDFEAFAPNERGIFFAEDRSSAQAYVSVRRGTAQRVIEAELDIRRPWTYVYYGLDVPFRDMADQSPAALKAQGYDGVYIPRERVWVAFDPDQVRITDVQTVEVPRRAGPMPAMLTPEKRPSAFERWFGQSRVVDAHGKPKVLYHGGQKLTAWNRPGDDSQIYGGHAQAVKREYGSMLSKEEIQALDKPVHFFTDDESVAAGYADQGSHYEVRSHYLKMERPLDLRVDVMGAEAVEASMKRVLGDDYELPASGYGQSREISQALRWNWSDIREKVEGLGYDGIILHDTDVRDRSQHTAYAVFEPTQIKSATDNRGTYDPGNPDIRFSVPATQGNGDPSSPFDFASDDRFRHLFYGQPSAREIREFSSWLRARPNAFVRLYHGTAAVNPIEEQGILPCSTARRNSLQSAAGYVCLSVFPGLAYDFGAYAAMNRPAAADGARVAVYPVTRTVRALLADLDQLRNRRLFAGEAVGNSLAESLVHGRGARVRGRVDPGSIGAARRYRSRDAEIVSSVEAVVRGEEPFHGPAFKRWFDGSRAVDAGGRPLVLYHGTAGDFSEFRPSSGGEFGPAIYTTDNPREAGEYGVGQQKPGVNVMPVYVRIKRPYDKGVDAFWKTFGADDGDAAAVQRAIEQGYDGVIASRADRYYDNELRQFIDRGDDTLAHYIAFRPEQIKSAIGNRGTFEVSSPDIRFSFAGDRAATADIPALRAAQSWVEAGAMEEGERVRTGWFKGVDGRWRFEIDDSKASILPALQTLSRGGYEATTIASVTYRKHADGLFDICLNPPNPQKVSDFVQLIRVTRAVADAILPQDVIERMDLGEGDEDLIGDLEPARRVACEFQFGGMNVLPLDQVLDHPELFKAYPALRTLSVQVMPSMGLSASYCELEDGMRVIRLGLAHQRSNLMHEIQHAIQTIEGFALGGSPEVFRARQASSLPMETVNLALSIRELSARSGQTVEAIRARPPRFLREASEDAWRLAAIRSGRSLQDEFVHALSARSPMDSYMRLAGEVEARNVQARLDFDVEMRRRVPPSETADVGASDMLLEHVVYERLLERE